jgi:hypothetical protein
MLTYDFSPSTRSDPELTARADEALGFVAREQVATYVRGQSGLTLCGAGESCPGG